MSSLKTTVTEHQEMTEFGPMTTHRTVAHSSCSQCQNMIARISLLEKKLGVAVEKFEAILNYDDVGTDEICVSIYTMCHDALETIRNMGGEGETDSLSRP